MPESLVNILQYVCLGIDIFAVVCLVLTVLKGFTNGVFKFLFTSGIKWVLVFVGILFSKQIAVAILSANYPGIGQLDVYLVQMLCSQFELDYETIVSTYSYDLIYGVVVGTMRIIIILLTTVVVSLIIYPIVSLILKITGVRKLVTKLPKGLLSRGLGMVAAAFTFCVYFCITFMPYYGTVSVALDVQDTASKIIEIAPTEPDPSPEGTEVVKTEAAPLPDSSSDPSVDPNTENQDFDLNRIVEKSFLLKMFNKGKSNVAVDYLNFIYVIETNNKKVYLIKEFYNVSDLAPFVMNLVKNIQNKETISLSKDDFNKIMTFIQNSDFVDILVPVSLEVMIAMKTFEQLELDINFDTVHNVNWEEETKQLDKVLETLKDAYSLVFDNQSDLKTILGTSEFSTVVPELVSNLYNLSLVKQYGCDFIDKKVDEYIAQNPDQNALQILKDLDYRSVLENDISRICLSLSDAYNLGLLEAEKHFDFSIEQNRTYLANIINNIFDLSIVKGKENTLIDYLFEYTSIKDVVDKESLPLDQINWETEPDALVGVLTEYLTLVGNDIKDYKKALFSENNDALLSNLCNSDVFTKVLLYVLDGKIDEMLINQELTDLADVVDLKKITKENLESDLKKITSLYNDFMALGIPNSPDLSNEESVNNVLNKLLDLSFVVNNESVIVDSLLKISNANETLVANGIVLNYEGVNWKEEVAPLSHLVSLIFTNQNIFDDLQNITDEKKPLVTDLMDSIINLQIINRSIPNLVSKVLTDAGLTEWQSSWLEEQKVNFDKESWIVEVHNLIDAVAYYQNNAIDLNNITPENLNTIRPLLLQIAELKTFTLNPIVNVINDQLQATLGTTEEYLSVPSDINWSNEINLIFAEDGIYQAFVNFNTSSTYREYGRLLDKMFTSSIFKTSGYKIIQSYIRTLPIYGDIIIEDDISDANLSLVTSWENELGLIDEIDLSAGVQTGAVLDKIMRSQILKRQITVYVNDIITSYDLGEYYTAANVNEDIEKVNLRIKESKQDADPTNDYSWEKEVNNLKAFSDKLYDVTGGSLNKTEVQALVNIASSGVITSRMFTKVLEVHPEIKGIIDLL